MWMNVQMKVTAVRAAQTLKEVFSAGVCRDMNCGRINAAVKLWVRVQCFNSKTEMSDCF